MSTAVNEFLAAKGVTAESGELKHYGVPGMKWGQRKSRSSGVSSPSSARAQKVSKTSQPESRKVNTFKSNPKNKRLTDAELRNRLNRLQMEKQYADLTASPKGRSFAKQLMVDTGKTAVRQVASRAVNVTVQLALEGAARNAKGPNKVFFEAMAAQGKGKKNK